VSRDVQELSGSTASLIRICRCHPNNSNNCAQQNRLSLRLRSHLGDFSPTYCTNHWQSSHSLHQICGPKRRPHGLNGCQCTFLLRSNILHTLRETESYSIRFLLLVSINWTQLTIPQVLRWSALAAGVFYGLYHQASLTASAKLSAINKEYEHKQSLIEKAKAEYSKKHMPAEKKTESGDGTFKHSPLER
jgi:hypothetical protein